MSHAAPATSFLLDAGWQAYFNDAEGAYLGGPDGIEMVVLNPPKVVDPQSGQGIDVPPALATWLANAAPLGSVRSTAVRWGGRQATRIDAMAVGDRALFYSPNGNFHTVSGLRYRFFVLAEKGPDLVLVQLGPGKAFDSDATILDAIVGSTRFGGG